MDPICPKCGGTMDKGRTMSYYSLAFLSDKVKASWFSNFAGGAGTKAFACTQCGYVEQYIDAAELRSQLKSVKR